ncbi:hypothetical protein TRICI_002227 [Trichomonascus ciferrii]|uniref:Arrestin C-terminal-like domain-containing protein n=1 Tax=Trichomonascus ciferrii TaxID=44093 RepID=A0A642V6F5_9ASCO|nr:hypothetical protein TRICI_002227 [Trichomonascus ciferrii]
MFAVVLTGLIRIQSADREVILLRGSPEDASSHLLRGMVSVSVPDPSAVKKVHLKLTGTMKLKWVDHVQTPRGTIAKPVKFEKTVYEHDWGNILSGSSRPSPAHSPVGSRNTSSTNLAGMAAQNGNARAAAAPPALELPFEVVIPGDTPESVEGMQNGSVVYRLQAVVERGRFTNNITGRKLVRIVRTIGSDSFELTQTMAIENTWPNKVDYSIETPSKAVAIGSSCRVHFLLVPLLKGLKLGPVKTQLIEYTTLASPSGHVHNGEKVVLETKSRPNLNPEESEDRWSIYENVILPSSLTKCTQDCQVGSSIKVSHKLKFGVSLINPDGHTSELRASLPIYLFISPTISVSSADPTQVSYPGHEVEEEPLFDTPNVDPVALATSEDTYLSQGIDVNAPPNYHDHIYDRLWHDIPTSTAGSPTHSGENSPYVNSRRNSLDADGLGMTSLDNQTRSQLAAGLRALENYQNNGRQTASSSGPTTPGLPTASENYFNARPVNSTTPSSPIDTPGAGSDVDIEALSRVPSYSTAIRQDGGAVSNTDLAPEYDAPSSPHRRPSLRNSHVHTNMSTSLPGSSANLHNIGATLNTLAPLSSNGSTSGRNSSSNSGSSTNLRAHNRNHSSSALSSLIHRSQSSKSLFEGLLKRNN